MVCSEAKARGHQPVRSHVKAGTRRVRSGLAGFLSALLGAFAGAAWSEGPTVIDPPAALGTSFPAIASEDATTVDKGHDVLMTWLEPGTAGGQLKFARFSVGAWTQAITIAENVSAPDPTDRASLTVLNTQSVRRTLIARTGNVVARSGDAGRTWTRLPSPLLPFASFAGGEEGGYVFWLSADGETSAKLLGTRILAGQALLDRHASAGSGTSAAMTWDGPIVVYRDWSEAGAQDIAIVRRQNAQWTRPRPVHHVAGWRPARTPVSGPEVAVLRRQVAVAWYTESPHRPRVLVALSADAGRTFGPPFEVAVKTGERAPLPFLDVALDEEGLALVLWMGTTGPTAADLNLTRIALDGSLRGDELVLAEGLTAHLSNIPQITRAGDHVAATWIDDADDPAVARLRAVLVPLAAVSAPGSHRPDPVVAAALEGRPAVDSGRGRVGELAPDFQFTSLDGEEVSLATLRGRVVLLNLWATWCLPCIAEMPELAALEERYAGEGLTVVGLSVDAADAEDRVHAFVAQREIPFTVWLDPKMLLYKALRVKTLPVTLVLDREGRVVARRDEAITADDPEFGAAIRQALDGSGPDS